MWSLKTAWGNFHSTLRGTHNLVLFPSEVLNEKLCEHPCTSISKVLSLRTSHESSSPLWKCILSAFSGYNLHTHILPQSHIRGCYPNRAVNELMLSLNQRPTTTSDVVSFSFKTYKEKNIISTKYNSTPTILKLDKRNISTKKVFIIKIPQTIFIAFID